MRGRASATGTFTLLPFLDLLSCTLGVLLFIVMSTTFVAVGPQIKEIWSVEGPVGKRVNIVEWDGENITVLPDKEVVPLSVAQNNNGDNSSRFGALLKRLAEKRDKEYLFIAIRPSGFGNFKELATLIHNRDKNIDFGYDAFEQTKEIEMRAGQDAREGARR